MATSVADPAAHLNISGQTESVPSMHDGGRFTSTKQYLDGIDAVALCDHVILPALDDAASRHAVAPISTTGDSLAYLGLRTAAAALGTDMDMYRRTTVLLCRTTPAVDAAANSILQLELVCGDAVAAGSSALAPLLPSSQASQNAVAAISSSKLVTPVLPAAQTAPSATADIAASAPIALATPTVARNVTTAAFGVSSWAEVPSWRALGDTARPQWGDPFAAYLSDTAAVGDDNAHHSGVAPVHPPAPSSHNNVVAPGDVSVATDHAMIHAVVGPSLSTELAAALVGVNVLGPKGAALVDKRVVECFSRLVAAVSKGEMPMAHAAATQRSIAAPAPGEHAATTAPSATGPTPSTPHPHGLAPHAVLQEGERAVRFAVSSNVMSINAALTGRSLFRGLRDAFHIVVAEAAIAKPAEPTSAFDAVGRSPQLAHAAFDARSPMDHSPNQHYHHPRHHHGEEHHDDAGSVSGQHDTARPSQDDALPPRSFASAAALARQRLDAERRLLGAAPRGRQSFTTATSDRSSPNAQPPMASNSNPMRPYDDALSAAAHILSPAALFGSHEFGLPTPVVHISPGFWLLPRTTNSSARTGLLHSTGDVAAAARHVEEHLRCGHWDTLAGRRQPPHANGARTNGTVRAPPRSAGQAAPLHRRPQFAPLWAVGGLLVPSDDHVEALRNLASGVANTAPVLVARGGAARLPIDAAQTAQELAVAATVRATGECAAIDVLTAEVRNAIADVSAVWYDATSDVVGHTAGLPRTAFAPQLFMVGHSSSALRGRLLGHAAAAMGHETIVFESPASLFVETSAETTDQQNPVSEISDKEPSSLTFVRWDPLSSIPDVASLAPPPSSTKDGTSAGSPRVGPSSGLGNRRKEFIAACRKDLLDLLKGDGSNDGPTQAREYAPTTRVAVVLQPWRLGPLEHLLCVAAAVRQHNAEAEVNRYRRRASSAVATPHDPSTQHVFVAVEAPAYGSTDNASGRACVHVAIAVSAEFLLIGPPNGGENTALWNELARAEEAMREGDEMVAEAGAVMGATSTMDALFGGAIDGSFAAIDAEDGVGGNGRNGGGGGSRWQHSWAMDSAMESLFPLRALSTDEIFQRAAELRSSTTPPRSPAHGPTRP